MGICSVCLSVMFIVVKIQTLVISSVITTSIALLYDVMYTLFGVNRLIPKVVSWKWISLCELIGLLDQHFYKLELCL